MDPDLKWYQQPITGLAGLMWIFANLGMAIFARDHWLDWTRDIADAMFGLSLLVAIATVALSLHAVRRSRR